MIRDSLNHASSDMLVLGISYVAFPCQDEVVSLLAAISMFFRLSKSPDICEKAVEKVDNFHASSELITCLDSPHMPYIQACIKIVLVRTLTTWVVASSPLGSGSFRFQYPAQNDRIVGSKAEGGLVYRTRRRNQG